MKETMPTLYFFVGKGGVGKSTLSALTSLYRSRNQQKTLLVSMDPAHNQQDIFQCTLSEKPTSVAGNLWIKQIDTEQRIQSYLKDTEDQLSKNYNYLRAFSIKDHFRAFQFSPGIEEHAMLQAFSSIFQEYQDKELIIFDMPPTTLTLRFFSLPGITLAWIKELIKLREKIFRKQEIVSRIRFGKRQMETDPVLHKLRKMKKDYEKLSHLFKSPKILIQLVIKPDSLAMSESQRIYQKLRDLDLPLANVLLNGSSGETRLKSLAKDIPAGNHHGFPEYSGSLIGLSNLEDYLNTQEHPLEQV